MIDLINLPSPLPLFPSLLDAGFSHEIATAASKIYQQRAEELKRRTEMMFIATWQKIVTVSDASTSSLDPLTRKDISTFTEVYLRYLEEWKEEIIQLLRQASKVSAKAAPRNSRSFNHEYLPLLEHFFEENPFPTHADKVFLAKKSNMQYKQIHVWFQNRRSRTKKEAKPLRKKPTSESATKPLDKLYERMKGYMVNPTSQTLQPQASPSGVDGETRVAQSNASKCVFISPPPPHAFPSSYPPTCAYDPFPCTSGPISLEKPEWRRVSCSKLPPSVSVSLDDLVEKFSQLNVRGDARTKGSPRLGSHAATAAITVVPSHAPHPSLIVHKHPKFAHVAVHHPSVRAPTLRLHAFQCPSPTSKPVTLIPHSASSYRSEPFTKRKTIPLPQRFPGRMENTKHATTPSECSFSSSRVFSASSKSRSYSLSSVSSSSSPTDMASVQERSSSCTPFDSFFIPPASLET